MPAAFKLPAGSAFARVFDTPRGQILATIEPNEDDNASLVLRAWTVEGLGEVWLGIAGGRAEGADCLFTGTLASLTAERVLSAWELALDNHSRVGIG